MFKMKHIVSLLVVITGSVAADFTPELENALDLELGKIELYHLRNMTKFTVMSADHPHAHMKVTELGEYYNYGAEIHTIITDDGYILEMHRFTGNQTNLSSIGKQPVLLVHGLLCSSMDWVIAGPGRGLAFILADLGYDVWMGNVRGNKYSHMHNNTAISKFEYYDVSFHEIGKYDLPAMIDHILKLTKYKKIYYIGHSQGTAHFWAMLSERPEYNDKIIGMTALAPVAFLSHLTSPVFRALSILHPTIDVIFRLFGKYEFKPTGKFFNKFAKFLCDETHITQPICTNIIFLICGYSEELLDEKLLPAILAHVPAGSSTKQFIHLSQLVKSGYFRQFDYGWLANYKKYKSFSPPEYKLNNIKVPVSLYYSTNDWLVTPIDVNKLYSKLPNVVGKFLVPHKKFNHLDFVWGLNVKTLLYDKVIDIMKQQINLYTDEFEFLNKRK